MQDRYFGDIGDFAKYGMLRKVCSDEPEWRLCVLWYRVPDQDDTNDGRHIRYLEPTPENLKAFHACDPELFDELGRLVRRGTRSVSMVAGSVLLPQRTIYHDEALSYRGIAKRNRKAHRDRWINAAHHAARDAAVVFLDPDNGLEVGTDRHGVKGPKYVFYDDLAPLVRANKTVIVYQHANRNGSFADQIQCRFAALRHRLGRPTSALLALRWKRTSPRAFIFILGDGHALLHERVHALIDGPWGHHFELVNPGS